MNQALKIDKIEFVFARENNSEVRLDVQILKNRGIIPLGWELSESSTYNEEMNLIVFQNGICILNQEDIIACLETINDEDISDLVVSDIAYKYLNEFPEESFQALGINIEGYTIFPSQVTARNWFLKTFFDSDVQHESDRHLIQAVFNCIYKLDRGVLTLTVRNTEIALSEHKSLSVIKFSANFHHDVSRFSKEERLQALSQSIGDWKTDVRIYREVVHCKFLEAQNIPLR